MLGHFGQTYLAYLGAWQELGSLGGLLGASWVDLEASWTLSGDILGGLGGHLERLGSVLEGLGGVLKANMSQDVILGALGGCLGRILEALGGVLDAYRTVLEALGSVLEASWRLLKAFWRLLESSRRPCWAKIAFESENLEKHKEK